MRSVRLALVLLAFAFAFCVYASANSCDPFSVYMCAANTPNAMSLVGKGTTGDLVGIQLGTTFSVSFSGTRSSAGGDLILIAAAPNGLTGTLNGDSFTSLSTFPVGGAPAAIKSTWNAMGIDFKSPAFGYVNLGTIGSLPFSVAATGVGKGTIFYAEVVNPKNDTIYLITPNAEAGILGGPSAVTPEPASLTLLGIGLVGLAGLLHRKTAPTKKNYQPTGTKDNRDV